jgi:hypothetical protein
VHAGKLDRLARLKISAMPTAVKLIGGKLMRGDAGSVLGEGFLCSLRRTESGAQ